jgi:alpha-L-arabinofuranosidase
MLTSFFIAALVGTAKITTNPAQLTLHIDQKGPRVSPSLFGVFFEEINHAGDGGIYAELIRNGSFENNAPMEAWKPVLDIPCEVVPTGESSKYNTKALRVSFSGKGSGIENEGFWGISVVSGGHYKLSLRARLADDSTMSAIPWRAELVGSTGTILAQADIVQSSSIDKKWKWLKTDLQAKGTDPKAKLRITQIATGIGPSVALIDNVSLFPTTWKNRPNGLRPDLVKCLADLKPAFVRFPGGCWVEGDTMTTSMRWKQTIGPVAERRTLPNLWGYQSTNGLGFHEYLQMCEDLNADALFVINCGMSHKSIVPMAEMDEFVQDALDAIEYANGAETTKWGKVRAQAGHPKPFRLKYLEIGNENGGQAYRERYLLIYNAIKKRFPDVVLIADDWGGRPQGVPIDMIDEHYYLTPQAFMQYATKYDSYDRKGPKIYVGEYAVTQGCGNGNLIAALGEAAFMTGMERNADVVKLCSYAPLFANINQKAWNPDLIIFNSSQVFGIPSYHVQKLFAQNRYDTNIGLTIEDTPAEKPKFTSGGIGVGTWGTQSEYKDIKVVSNGKVLFENADGSQLKRVSGQWEVVDGALRQTSEEEGTRAIIGDKDWNEYTLTLKARKVSGYEGFLITVGNQDKDNWLWWNIGGWGNSRNSIEMSVAGGKQIIGRDVPIRVESNRWYDIKIVYSPSRIQCFLDGKKTHDATRQSVKTLFASAGLIDKSGELIVKIVNTSDQPKNLDILTGIDRAYSGTMTVLTSGHPLDENSFENPLKVSPKTNRITLPAKGVKVPCPAYSLTILRLKPVTRQAGGNE